MTVIIVAAVAFAVGAVVGYVAGLAWSAYVVTRGMER